MILLTPLLCYQANQSIIPTTNFLNSILNNQQNIGESEGKNSAHLKEAVSRETLKQELIAKAFAHILENNLIAKANEVVLSEGKLRVSRSERVPLLDLSQISPLLSSAGHRSGIESGGNDGEGALGDAHRLREFD